jgi:hypothetical protein
MKLCHTPVIEELPTTHRVAKVHLPTIVGIDVTHRGSSATLCHHSMSLTKERFTDDRNRESGLPSLNRSAKTRSAGTDHQDVVLESALTHSNLHP